MMDRIYDAALAHMEGEEGGHAIEYALIAALIALVMAGGATYLGQEIMNFFNRIGLQLTGY